MPLSFPRRLGIQWDGVRFTVKPGVIPAQAGIQKVMQQARHPLWVVMLIKEGVQ